MKRLTKAGRKNRFGQFLPECASTSILALFFSFFFIFAQASDFASTGVSECASENNGSLQQAHLIGSHQERHHLPLNSVPLPQQSESKDEREKNHESDDNSEQVVGLLSLKGRFDVTSDKCLLLRLLHSHYNREEISLFVLHHSWKSFLS